MTKLAKQIDYDYVEHRIDDWETRLNDLYAKMEVWAKELGAIEIVRTVVPQAREELMQQFDVEPRFLPALTIRTSDNRVSFMPMALWVIGANGRLTIKTSKNHYILIDIGGTDGDSSVWEIVSPLKRNQRLTLNKQLLEKMMKDENPFP